MNHFWHKRKIGEEKKPLQCRWCSRVDSSNCPRIRSCSLCRVLRSWAPPSPRVPKPRGEASPEFPNFCSWWLFAFSLKQTQKPYFTETPRFEICIAFTITIHYTLIFSSLPFTLFFLYTNLFRSKGLGIIGTRYPNPILIFFFILEFANLTLKMITLFNLKLKKYDSIFNFINMFCFHFFAFSYLNWAEL